MKKTLLLIGIVASLTVAASFAQAQALKIGYVDSEKILADLPEAQQAVKELEDLIRGWNSELTKMDTTFQREFDDYQKKKAMMNQASSQAKEQELNELRQRYLQYQAQKFDPRQGEAVTEREKRLAPIRDRILKAIEGVAKDDGYSFVFDKANDAMVLFADVKYDLTYQVLDRLKRGVTKGK
ncbi:MAG: OmpH family outer membrane protein [Ignavibacteriae bacterium]|nr:OmpH family outer membrane protein [Ignavibacteriota bacterium]